MFTDRFIKVPVDLYNSKDADMVGYNEDTKEGATEMRINPFEVSHYRSSEDDKEDILNKTLVHMKNGDSFHVSITIEKFEKLLNEHK